MERIKRRAFFRKIFGGAVAIAATPVLALLPKAWTYGGGKIIGYTNMPLGKADWVKMDERILVLARKRFGDKILRPWIDECIKDGTIPKSNFTIEFSAGNKQLNELVERTYIG